MKKTKNIQTFRDVREYLSNIPYIHQGGCGLSAYVMYKWLEKNRKTNSFKFVFEFGERKLKVKNTRIIKTKNEKIAPAMPYHVIIQYIGNDMDANGKYRRGKYSYYHDVPCKEGKWLLERMLMEEHRWNDCFNRKYYQSRIEKTLNIDLCHLKK